MKEHDWKPYGGVIKTWADWECTQCHVVIYQTVGNPLYTSDYENDLAGLGLVRDCDESICQQVLEA